MTARNPFAGSGKGASRKRTASAGTRRLAKPAAAFDRWTAIDGLSDLPLGERLVLPWPPRELNPNHRIHGARKARFVRSYRETCWALALEAFGSGAGARMFAADGEIAVRLDFFPPNTSPRDDDNCEAAFKAGRDGVAQALGIDDRRFAVTRRLHTAPRGCVVMTFAAAEIGGQP